MDATIAPATRRRAHQRVAAAAIAAFAVFLVLGLVHGPASAEPTAPTGAPAATATPEARQQPQFAPPDENVPRFGPRRGGGRFRGGEEGGPGPGFGAPGGGQDTVPAPSTDGAGGGLS
jgi:hypothetical protein